LEDEIMNKVAILTDSTAYLPSDIIDRYQIQIIPLSVIWDGESYLDGIDITPSQFYKRLENSPTLPSTSQPPVGEFKKYFSSLLDSGKDVLAILISSGISGTVNSAIQAQAEMDQSRIMVIDSQTAAMATGLHVIAAARKAAEGGSLQEVAQVAEKAQHHTDVVFVVDTLEFLHKGGRIGGAKRFLGTMLNIKPILEMSEGKIAALEQVRTPKRALDRMAELIKEKAGGEKPLRMAVFHSNVPELAENLKNETQAFFSPDEIYISELSPAIGTHVGPGTLAIACMHGM
jgi:DegV family protein with EDD domain